MKSLVVVAIWLANLVGSFLSGLSGLTDWSLFGWALCGATINVVIEITKEKPTIRPLWHWPLLIFVGLVVSLGFNHWLSTSWGWPIVPVTIGLGAGGYFLAAKYLKNPDNPAAVLPSTPPTITPPTPDKPGSAT